MKSNQISATSGADDEVVLVMQKSKFPWWILLLLLPLLLLIPVPRNITIKFLETEAGAPAAGAPASVEYPSIATLGSHSTSQKSGNTSGNGIFQVSDISEPLWHYLMGCTDSLFVTCENGCAGINAKYCYQDFASRDTNVVAMGARSADILLTVVSDDDSEPLPDSKISITTDGGNEAQLITNEAGQATAMGMPACGQITATASREGFTSETITAQASQQPFQIRLKPEKGTLKVLAKELATKKAIPGASITLSLDGTQQTLKTNTNGVGIGTFDDVKLMSQIALSASKTGYADTTKQGFTASQFAQMNEEQRTMYMRKLEAPKPPKEEKREVPTPPLRGQKGELRINLSWTCKADLDIYVIDPCGNEIGPRNLKCTCNGSVGTLDIDANQDATNHPENARTDPQENVFWSKANSGNYRVKIVCCPLNRDMKLKSTAIPFTLVIEDRGKRTVKTGTINGSYTMRRDVELKDFYVHVIE